MDGDASYHSDYVGVMGRRHTDTAQLQIIDRDHPRRAEVEAFIAERYRQAFGAHIRQFMPVLFALNGQGQSLQSAAGMRSGGQGELFVERYLDAPAEYVLAQAFGAAVDRRRLVEIGHLSGMGHGAGRRLFPLIARWLEDSGVDWALFSATASLRTLFERMRVRPQALAPARRERLGAEAAGWGSYYNTDPWVVGGPLSLGRELLKVGA